MEEIHGIRKSFVIVSVFYVIAGVVLLFWPSMSIELFSRALGIGLLVYGLAHIVIYFTKDHKETIMNMDLSVGVICGAFGAFLLLHPDFILTATPFAIGILLMMGAIVKLQNSIDMRRLGVKRWGILLFFAIVLFIMGALLIYNPFAGRYLVIYIGIALILEGLLNVISMLTLTHIMKKMAKGKREEHMPQTQTQSHSQQRPIGYEEIAADVYPAGRPDTGNELEIKK